ncbi:hypothetical protein, partial [Methanothrix soehngenii]|uniref:hypothetical protein n=1 Tax=Methanothrix soehngenii TaxID=2223 RepID=UPI002B55C0B5
MGKKEQRKWLERIGKAGRSSPSWVALALPSAAHDRLTQALPKTFFSSPPLLWLFLLRTGFSFPELS